MNRKMRVAIKIIVSILDIAHKLFLLLLFGNHLENLIININSSQYLSLDFGYLHCQSLQILSPQISSVVYNCICNFMYIWIFIHILFSKMESQRKKVIVFNAPQQPNEDESNERGSNHNQEGDTEHQSKFNVKEILSTVFKNNLRKQQRNRIAKREQQPIWMYITTLILTLVAGTQNLYVFLWDSFPDKDKYIFFPSLVIRPIFFIACSYYFCGNWKVILKLYASLDRILVSQVGMMISVGIFSIQYIPYTSSPWVYYCISGFYPILLITFSGYYRVMMIFCKWKKIQTVMIKVAMALGAGAYFGLGMYYTVSDGKFTDGASQELDGIILNILLLYAFAGFSFHLQIFSVIDEVDGTNSYNLTYQLKTKPEDIECLFGKEGRIKSTYWKEQTKNQVQSQNEEIKDIEDAIKG